MTETVEVRRRISGVDYSLLEMWCFRYYSRFGVHDEINRSLIARAVLAYAHAWAQEVESTDGLQAVVTQFSYKLPAIPESVLSSLPERDSGMLVFKLPKETAEKYVEWHGHIGGDRWTKGRMTHAVTWLLRFGLRSLLHEDEQFVFDIFTDQTEEEAALGLLRGRPQKDVA